MDTSVEIRYAGVVVGRATQVRDRDPERLFVVMPDPLPVGSVVELTLDGAALNARVEGIVESADPAACGMRLHLMGGARVPAAAAPAAVPATPAAVAAQEDAPGAVPAESSGVVETVEDTTSGLVDVPEGGADDSGASSAPGNGQSGQPQGGGRKRRRKKR